MTKTDNKYLIVILGPTGVGKTDLSIKIAQRYNSEIISSDSRQMYREMRIGTAAPLAEQLETVKHHFIGNLSIYDYYNASKFEFEVIELLGKLHHHNDTALLVGGSTLYIDAVCKGIDDLPEIDQSIRNQLIDLWNQEGTPALLALLENCDSEYYKIVDKNNPKRILKALEIYRMTGKPYSEFRTNVRRDRPFKIITVGLTREREELYSRINQRVDMMISDGLVDEARIFHAINEKKALNSLNTVGYKELFGFFSGEYSQEEAIRLIKRNSRRYAKRQLTWFKRDEAIRWFNPTQKNEIFDFIDSMRN